MARLTNGDPVLDTLSPGIIGMYWLLANAAALALWVGASHLARRTTHRAGARCYSGTCTR